jgi:hypothetical protein
VGVVALLVSIGSAAGLAVALPMLGAGMLLPASPELHEVARTAAQRLADATGDAHEVRSASGVERFEPTNQGDVAPPPTIDTDFGSMTIDKNLTPPNCQDCGMPATWHEGKKDRWNGWYCNSATCPNGRELLQPKPSVIDTARTQDPIVASEPAIDEITRRIEAEPVYRARISVDDGDPEHQIEALRAIGDAIGKGAKGGRGAIGGTSHSFELTTLERPAQDPAQSAGPDAKPARAVAALGPFEEWIVGRFWGAVNVESDDSTPRFLFFTEDEAWAEIKRRKALPEDDDDQLSEHYQALPFDLEGVFWNSFDPNPRPAPTTSRIWEMQQEIEQLSRERDADRAAFRQALAQRDGDVAHHREEAERLTARVRDLEESVALLDQKGRQMKADLDEAWAHVDALRGHIGSAIDNLTSVIGAEAHEKHPTDITWHTYVACERVRLMNGVVHAALEMYDDRMGTGYLRSECAAYRKATAGGAS